MTVRIVGDGERRGELVIESESGSASVPPTIFGAGSETELAPMLWPSVLPRPKGGRP